MNISCPICGTIYRVDPAKVPEAGVRARCSTCEGVFKVKSEAEADSGTDIPPLPMLTSDHGAHRGAEELPAHAPKGEAPNPSERAGEEERAADSALTPSESVESAASTPESPEAPDREIQERADGLPAVAAPETIEELPELLPRPRQPFGVADPDAKARRLARALVSDIVVYHPERRERSLAAGTLRHEFRDEIRKSWEEYIAQIGEPLARRRPYFRDALNDILAGGKSVF